MLGLQYGENPCFGIERGLWRIKLADGSEIVGRKVAHRDGFGDVGRQHGRGFGAFAIYRDDIRMSEPEEMADLMCHHTEEIGVSYVGFAIEHEFERVIVDLHVGIEERARIRRISRCGQRDRALSRVGIRPLRSDHHDVRVACVRVVFDVIATHVAEVGGDETRCSVSAVSAAPLIEREAHCVCDVTWSELRRAVFFNGKPDAAALPFRDLAPGTDTRIGVAHGVRPRVARRRKAERVRALRSEKRDGHRERETNELEPGHSTIRR
jgi:hypothetical protein